MSKQYFKRLSINPNRQAFLIDLPKTISEILKNITPNENSEEIKVTTSNQKILGDSYVVSISNMNNAKGCYSGIKTTTISRKKFANKLTECLKEEMNLDCKQYVITDNEPLFAQTSGHHKPPLAVGYRKSTQTVGLSISKTVFESDPIILDKIKEAFRKAVTPKSKTEKAEASKLYALEEEKSLTNH